MNDNRARAACNLMADYSAVPSDPILPFVFSLDLASSNLYPAAGENQRFCYTVVGTGEDTSEYADLSHFVLGVCGDITEDMLENVSVVIDGEEQEIEIGENVLITASDPTTGCAGLKLDFGLDKDGGVMRFCFELAVARPIGPVGVCVKGGTASLRGLSICGPACSGEISCATYGSQRATVCVPVTVTPYAVVGDTTTYCCGSPVVTPGTVACGGVPGGSCTFTIRQDVCISVPVSFGADAVVGEYNVLCGGASSGEACPGCEEA